MRETVVNEEVNLLPIVLTAESATVNIEWVDRQHYIVFARSDFYKLQKQYPDNSTFWNVLTNYIVQMMSLSSQS